MSAIDHIRFRVRDGVELAASAAGDKGAPTVLLLHGGGQTRHAWLAALKRLAKEGYRAIGYDLRGHGESGWSPDGIYTHHRFSDDLLDVLETIESKTAVVGASLGGQAAIRAIAAERTPHVAAMVLVDIVPKPSRAGIRKVAAFMRANLHGFDNLDQVADAIAAYNPNRPRPTDLSGLKKNLRFRDGRYYWHWDPAFLQIGSSEDKIDQSEHDTMEAMKRVLLPCLLVRGGESDVVDTEVMADFRRRLVGLEVVEVPGAGHMVAGDKNDAFNDSAVAFLRRHLPL